MGIRAFIAWQHIVRQGGKEVIAQLGKNIISLNKSAARLESDWVLYYIILKTHNVDTKWIFYLKEISGFAPLCGTVHKNDAPSSL